MKTIILIISLIAIAWIWMAYEIKNAPYEEDI